MADGWTPAYSTGILAVFSLQSLTEVRGSEADDGFLVIVIGDKGLPRRLQIKGKALEHLPRRRPLRRVEGGVIDDAPVGGCSRGTDVQRRDARRDVQRIT